MYRPINILGCGWTISWTGTTTRGSRLKSVYVLCEDAESFQHLQNAPVDAVPVCGGQRPVMRCGVLGGNVMNADSLQSEEAV